jgi:hypothetical protein
VASFDRAFLKGEALRFVKDFDHPPHVKGHLNVGATSKRIWNVIS